MLTAKAMAEFGIKVQENIGVYSQNMPQCLYTDFGAYGNRVVSIPMYATNSPGQIEYIINDAKIRESTLFSSKRHDISPFFTHNCSLCASIRLNNNNSQ